MKNKMSNHWARTAVAGLASVSVVIGIASIVRPVQLWRFKHDGGLHFTYYDGFKLKYAGNPKVQVVFHLDAYDIGIVYEYALLWLAGFNVFALLIEGEDKGRILQQIAEIWSSLNQAEQEKLRKDVRTLADFVETAPDTPDAPYQEPAPSADAHLKSERYFRANALMKA